MVQAVRAFFATQVEQDARLHYAVTGAEVDALADRLTQEAWRGARTTLCRLALRYHVNLGPVLAIILRCRMAWRFEDSSTAFRGGVDLAAAEKMADRLDGAAEGLDRLRGFLTCEWQESVGKAEEALTGHPGGELDAEEIELDAEEMLRILCRAESRRHPGQPALWVSEAIEQAETLRLVYGGGKDDLRRVPQQIDDTIALLRKAAWTCRRREWGSATDARTGQRFFRRGRRRWWGIEADCARELVAYFRSETERGLLDHVGHLLVATFPETCGERWGHHHDGCDTGDGRRLRDDVAQLLAPPEQIAEES